MPGDRKNMGALVFGQAKNDCNLRSKPLRGFRAMPWWRNCGSGTFNFFCMKHAKTVIVRVNILYSDITSQIMPFSHEYFLHHYGRQLNTAVEHEADDRIDCKR